MKMDEANVIIEEEIAQYEMEEYQNDQAEDLKQRGKNVQTKITSNKKEIKDFLK